MEILCFVVAESMSRLTYKNAIQVKRIATVHHGHLVKLIGYCEENFQQLLVYDYLPNGNIGNHLYGILFRLSLLLLLVLLSLCLCLSH